MHIEFRRHHYPLTIFSQFSILSTTRLTWYFMYTFFFLHVDDKVFIDFFFLFLTHIEKTRRELSFRESFPMWHIVWLLCRLHLLIILFYISSIMFQWWWMWIRNKKKSFFFMNEIWGEIFFVLSRQQVFWSSFPFSYFIVYEGLTRWLFVYASMTTIFPHSQNFKWIFMYLMELIDLETENYDAKIARRKSFGISVESIEEKILMN